MTRKKILLVDDNPLNLTACKKTLKDLYDVYPAPSAEKMFGILKHITPDLILLDVEMPVTNGYEVMRILKENSSYKDIPVIFLSAMDDAESELEGLELGAVDYIHKPFVGALLIKRIATHIAVIDGKNELIKLNKSIEELLTPRAGEAKPRIEDEEEALKELMAKNRFFTSMCHQLRAPLDTIIKMIETSIMSDEIGVIKSNLGKADIETRLMLEILDDILDTEDNG